MSEEALQITEKRRDAKGKGEKERYAHLNAEFQRIVRREKKAFLSEQCKEIEENNRMGKTRDVFTKIKATKGTFHGHNKEMGIIKNRNGMDLTEAEDIRRGGKKTQKLYRSLKMTLLKHFTQYASKFESSAVATGLEKVRFHCNPKERQCQRMFKFTSVTQSCPTLCDHMDCSTPCFPVHHQLLESTQTYVR